MFTNIELLEQNLRKGLSKYNFYPGESPDKVYLVERAFGIEFPESYRQFINLCNGGMILEHEPAFYTDMTADEPDGPKQSSNYLLNLDELISLYQDLRLESWLFLADFKILYPIIPVCETSEGKLLIVLSSRGQRGESPVFLVDRNNEAGEFHQVASDFHAFLGNYIRSEGFPLLVPDNNKLPLRRYMEKKNIFNIALEANTYRDALERANALIELIPDSSWSYYERGVVHQQYGYINDALRDYNRTIRMDEKSAFYYYCRGDLILKHGSSRKALIDLDTAVQLKPNDLLYLNGRAEAFYKLGRLQEALNDCNKILAKDGINEIALSTRFRVYKALGEDEKAAADSALLDDLNRM